MRSPVIAFGLFAAAAVSPSLVSGAPTSPILGNDVETAMKQVPRQLSELSSLPMLSSTPQAAAVSAPQTPEAHRAAEAKIHNPAPSNDASMSPDTIPSRKRASDEYTAGGNSYSGASSGTTGGTIVNNANNGPNRGAGAGAGAGAGTPTLTNDGTGGAVNNAGNGGDSETGFSYGGQGGGHGPGGNAYSGSTGPSNGGSDVNTGDGITNNDANTAGLGGFDESGDAQGGNAAGPPGLNTNTKRAGDNDTAGGNAYSGATSNVSGGTVINQGQEDGASTNDGGNVGGNPGTSFSGYATGGDGDGRGPGGNAYTGASGPAYGGGVRNSGGTIDNSDGANTAGAAVGMSETGDAVGGNA